MTVTRHEEAVAANERFNYFRRGLVKAVRVVSGNAFLSDAQWARQETLLAATASMPVDAPTDLCPMNTRSVEVEIHHHHYGDPEAPRNRAVLIRADESELSDCLIDCVGRDVFELVLDKTSDGIACVLTSHPPGAGRGRTMANGRTEVLFSAPTIRIDESVWGEEKQRG